MPTAPRLLPAHDQEVCGCPFNVRGVRADFPILGRSVQGKPLIYLDNAATTQKPRAVIEALRAYYERHNANVHRGLHTLAEEATDLYEQARAACARFLGLADPAQIVFTRNTTESLNLLAWAWARRRLGPGDEILTTVMEHHSNLVPWQLVAQEVGAVVRYTPVTAEGRLDREAFQRLLSPRVRVFTVVHGSNVVGAINPVAELARELRAAAPRAVVIVDATQTAPQLPLSFTALGCDALVFSGHKAYGPTGVGVLAARRELLEETGPFLGGGEMVEKVTLEGSTFAPPPRRFEAGTPNIADAVGLAAALQYLGKLDLAAIRRHGVCQAAYALERLGQIPTLRILGPPDPAERVALVAFTDRDVHAHDLATILDRQGVAIRAGHHCAMPLAHALNSPASARASFGVYNTRGEVDLLVGAILHARERLGHAQRT